MSECHPSNCPLFLEHSILRFHLAHSSPKGPGFADLIAKICFATGITAFTHCLNSGKKALSSAISPNG